MKKVKELTRKDLRPGCDLKLFKFKTTQDLPDLKEVIGQTRALNALEFGLNMKKSGFHIFALGPPGIGKRTIVLRILKKKAPTETTPNDWCYVYNFKKPKEPIAIELPPSQGLVFQNDMKHILEELNDLVPPILDFDATAINALLTPLKKKYKDFHTIVRYLNNVETDIIHHAEYAIKPKKYFYRYYVNVLIDHSKTQGAPIIYENNPTVENLFGILTPDYENIQPGSLHYANGGYLIIDMNKLQSQTESWEILKCILASRKITINTTKNTIEPIPLRPQAIPLNIKVILLGERSVYHSLCDDDADFLDLFKVAAEFEDQFERNTKNEQLYAQLIATIARGENLLPLTASAVKRIIEQGCRLIEDSKKLSIHLGNLVDLLCESNYWARKANRKAITDVDVQNAIIAEINRVNRAETKSLEEFERKFILLDTKRERIGQVNALTVVQEGNYSYGRPSKITAIAQIGRMGDIVNIEREIDLSDSIHSKGILILTGFLRDRFAKKQPLSLSASITFEQLYENIEGDSASAAELCALLSALANTPIKQSLAITGSINQYGEIQPIGYVNEKIEAFFDICKTKGLTSNQGVLIPAANIENLMVKEELVNAVTSKKFHIYPIKTIDEAITLLTGIPAGKRSKSGKYPRDTINDKVDRCLQAFAQEIIEEHNE